MAKKSKVPEKYTAGLKKGTAAARKAEIRKRTAGKKSFKPLPGDKKAETRPSTYTGKVKRSGLQSAISDRMTKLKGSQRDRFIQATSDVTQIPKRIIEKVFKKGEAAWAVGHRPGASQAAWARARIYSFLTGGKTSKTADAALYLEAKEALKGKKFRLP
jgi:hypothetical protein